jgi:hypothetical protein
MYTFQKRLGNNISNKLMLTLFSLLLSAITFAQETKNVDVNISTDSGGGGFFGSPVVWVIGIAVFILLLVALLHGGGRRNGV